GPAESRCPPWTESSPTPGISWVRRTASGRIPGGASTGPDDPDRNLHRCRYPIRKWMKASVFTWEYPPAIYGGAGVHAKYITMALAKLIKVEVRTLDIGAPPEIEGVNVLRYQSTLRGLATGDPRIIKALQVLSFNMNMVAYPIPASRVAVIHNGVDPQKYYPRDGLESVAKFSIRKPYVFFVGRLSRQKGIFDLLNAMDGVPEGTTLVLATGKPDTPEIEDD